MNELDLVKSLTAQASNKRNVMSTQTTTVIGEATSDSKDGKVFVDFSGESVSGNGEQSVEVDTTVSVKAGDIVRVSLVGDHAKNPCVTGVVGGGDRTDTEIAEVREIAERGGNPNAIVSITDYFYQTIQTQPPAQPTEASHDGWLTTEPIWGADEEGNEWVSTRTVTAGGTTTWTAPSQVQTYANVTVAKNAILSEVSSTYTSQNTFNQTTRAMSSAISQNASCIASKVSVGESGIEDISTTMLQNANGVNIFNGDLQTGDSYAHIDSDSFDIKLAESDSGVDDTNDKTVASFGETTTLQNDTGRLVLNSLSLYGEQKDTGNKSFEFLVGYSTGRETKTTTYDDLFQKTSDYTTPEQFYSVSELTDNGYIYAIITAGVNIIGQLDPPTYEWKDAPIISMDVHRRYLLHTPYGDEWRTQYITTDLEVPSQYYSEDDSIFGDYDPFMGLRPPSSTALVRYVKIPGPRRLLELAGGIDDLTDGSYYNYAEYVDIYNKYYEYKKQSLAGSARIGEGANTRGPNAVAIGEGTDAGDGDWGSRGPYVALGRYNVTADRMSRAAVLVVGNGTDDDHRNNAVEVLQNGNVYLNKDIVNWNGDLKYVSTTGFNPTQYTEAVLFDCRIDSSATARNHTTVKISLTPTTARATFYNGATRLFPTIDPPEIKTKQSFIPSPYSIVEYDIIAVRNNNATDLGTWFSKHTLRVNERERNNGASFAIQLIRQEFNSNNSCQAFTDPTIVYSENNASSGTSATVTDRNNITITFQAINTRYGSPRFSVIARRFIGDGIHTIPC